MIGPLTDPTADGGRAEDGFDSCPVTAGLRLLRKTQRHRLGWDHDIESVLGASLRARWVRERIDDLKLFDDGSGPAVRDDDRERVGMTRGGRG